MSSPIPLIIDCDPGIDDALALFVALAAPTRLHLLGITCVAGNRPVRITSQNASRIVAVAGRPDVPVYSGAAHPLNLAEPRCNLVHGEDGLGGVRLPRGKDLVAESAARFIARSLEDAPSNSVTIAAIGPLTNLALAERLRPGVLQRAKALVIMGGAVDCPGNITPRAEFNFYADPSAARCVLESGAAIQLFGLDVTSKAVMSDDWIDGLGRQAGRCSRLAHHMLVSYSAQDPLLHDACPIAWLIEPSLFQGADYRLSVDDTEGLDEGKVIVLPSATNPLAQADAELTRQVHVSVSLDVDRHRLMDLVLAHLRELP